MLHYIEGPRNVLADSLSRCQRLPSRSELAEATHLVPPSDEESIDEIEGYFLESKELDPIFTELYQAGIQDTAVREILDCYVNLPDEELV